MINTMKYKGYFGSVEFSAEDVLFTGKVIGIRSLISYEGKSAQELIDNFHRAVDNYLGMCVIEGFEPEITYSGNLSIQIPTELHMHVDLIAKKHNMSVDQLVEYSIRYAIQSKDPVLNTPA